MAATYPDTTWSEDACASGYDGGVEVTWTYYDDSAVADLYQQCAYRAGSSLGTTGVFTPVLQDGAGCDGGTCDMLDDASIAAASVERQECFCVQMAPGIH